MPGWRGRWEGGSGWGIYVNPWLIHVNVWQKLLQYRKVISLQLIKINGKNNKCIFSGKKMYIWVGFHSQRGKGHLGRKDEAVKKRGF